MQFGTDHVVSARQKESFVYAKNSMPVRRRNHVRCCPWYKHMHTVFRVQYHNVCAAQYHNVCVAQYHTVCVARYHTVCVARSRCVPKKLAVCVGAEHQVVTGTYLLCP